MYFRSWPSLVSWGSRRHAVVLPSDWSREGAESANPKYCGEDNNSERHQHATTWLFHQDTFHERECDGPNGVGYWFVRVLGNDCFERVESPPNLQRRGQPLTTVRAGNKASGRAFAIITNYDSLEYNVTHVFASCVVKLLCRCRVLPQHQTGLRPKQR